VRDLNLDTEIVVCPIVREPDGLALSSRNVYLDERERASATVLHRALSAARDELGGGTRDALQVQSTLRRVVESEPRVALDYAEVVDAESFEPVTRISRACYVVIAAFVGRTRLIDNLHIEPTSGKSEDFVFQL
jgi:pantoate--beta-alanine ligase